MTDHTDTQPTPGQEKGPIYGVPLIDSLPLGDGGFTQAMPSRSDLEGIRNYRQGQRVVAGYEVLLAAYLTAVDMAKHGHTLEQSNRTLRAALELAEKELDIESRSMTPLHPLFGIRKPRLDAALTQARASLAGTGASPTKDDRLARIKAIFDEWMADDSGYDEAVWPKIQAALASTGTTGHDDEHRHGELASTSRNLVKAGALIAAEIDRLQRRLPAPPAAKGDAT